MTRPAPHARKVKVRELSTGTVFEAWSVDAREMVGGHPDQYAYVLDDSPLGPPEAPSAPPAPPTPSPAEILADKSYDDLVALAKKAGIKSFGVKRDDLVAALLPHVAGGTLSLDNVALPANAVVARPSRIET